MESPFSIEYTLMIRLKALWLHMRALHALALFKEVLRWFFPKNAIKDIKHNNKLPDSHPARKNATIPKIVE